MQFTEDRPLEPRQLKLYVTGPAVSSAEVGLAYSFDRTFVLAETPEQAISLAGDLSGDEAYEVAPSSATVVVRLFGN